MNNLQKQQIQDRNVINYLEKYKVATTDTLSTLFFSNLLAGQRRLKKLSEDYKVINRNRDHISQQYYYYINRPKQLYHRLLLTNFHREIVKKGFKVVSLENEFSYFEKIRPDAFLAYEHQSRKYISFIETERSNRPNIEKYELFYKSYEWQNLFPVFPTIIWITSKQVPATKLPIVHIKEDLSNINILCKD